MARLANAGAEARKHFNLNVRPTRKVSPLQVKFLLAGYIRMRI